MLRPSFFRRRQLQYDSSEVETLLAQRRYRSIPRENRCVKLLMHVATRVLRNFCERISGNH